MNASEWYFDNIFPSPVWRTETKLATNSLEKLAYSLEKEKPTGRVLSNEGGWQSWDIFEKDYKELTELKSLILEQAHRCVIDYGHSPGVGNLEISNFWININRHKESNRVHIHDGAFISGVFYIKAEEDQGRLYFQKNVQEVYILASRPSPIIELTDISAPEVFYAPKTGRMLMFPGNLPHGVEANFTEKDRISISWNVLYNKDSNK